MKKLWEMGIVLVIASVVGVAIAIPVFFVAIRILRYAYQFIAG